MTLALFGGRPAIEKYVKSFSTVGFEEIEAAKEAILTGPMSGFLGGQPYGGPYVQRLEELWANRFGVKHAIACNSATSGLLAACSLFNGDRVFTTPFTMSATSAAPRFFDRTLVYGDVDEDYFTLTTKDFYRPDSVVVTNLFGHPANLMEFKELCTKHYVNLIEDNAQSLFAMEGSRYAGTFGDVGVFSLNIHKHIQCGEGGICVTNDDNIASHLRHFINHGEMAGRKIGLNLRMTEVTAAIAIAQFKKADAIVTGRIKQAEALSEVASKYEWITPPAVRAGCKHVYYLWAAKFNHRLLGIPRKRFIEAMTAEGMPLQGGYVAPLYRLPAFEKFSTSCPVAEDLHDNTLVLFENCAWTLTDEQIEQFSLALKKIENNILRLWR